jgi:hypothetical protein
VLADGIADALRDSVELALLRVPEEPILQPRQVLELLEPVRHALELLDGELLVVATLALVEQLLRHVDRQPLRLETLDELPERARAVEHLLRHLRELEPLEDAVDLIEIRRAGQSRTTRAAGVSSDFANRTRSSTSSSAFSPVDTGSG